MSQGRSKAILLVAGGLLLMVGGCNTWRIVPTHGGGKRFDEEQRAVSGSIRQAIADMKLHELAGHKVLLQVDTLAQNGGGSLMFPGFNNLYGSIGQNAAGTVVNNQTGGNLTDSKMEIWNLGFGYNPNPMSYMTVFGTDADFEYLKASLGMKLRHETIQPVLAEPEYVLYILVDVLGTNRYRKENFLAWQDHLNATCELTYYAMDVKANTLLFRARRSSGQATYVENSLLGFAAFDVQRTILPIAPSPMPVDTSDVFEETPSSATFRMTTKEEAKEAEEKKTSKEVCARRRELDKKLLDADIQLQTGNLALAQEYLDEICDECPHYPGVKEIYSRLEQLLALKEEALKKTPVTPPAPAKNAVPSSSQETPAPKTDAPASQTEISAPAQEPPASIPETPAPPADTPTAKP